MSRVFITGDVHGVTDIAKLYSFSQSNIGRSLTRDDYVIVCGDMGCVWDCGKMDMSAQSLYEDYP